MNWSNTTAGHDDAAKVVGAHGPIPTWNVEYDGVAVNRSLGSLPKARAPKLPVGTMTEARRAVVMAFIVTTASVAALCAAFGGWLGFWSFAIGFVASATPRLIGMAIERRYTKRPV